MAWWARACSTPSRTLFQEVGAHILFVFLLLSGLLLLTGASVAGIVKGTRESVASTTRRVRKSTGEFAAVLRTERTRPLPPEDDQPPEVEPVVRATHVEVPPEEEDVDDFDLEDEPEADEVEEVEAFEEEPDLEPDAEVEEEPAQEELTPMGNRRTPVTESDDLDYRLPRDKFLTRSSGTQKTDVKGIERGGRQVVEALAHFSVDAQVTGTVSGPHVTRYELRLAPGIKMSKVANLKDDLAYAMAAEHVRILAPDPRQAGGRRRGAQPGAQDGPPGRRAPGGAPQVVAAHRLAGQGHRRQVDRDRPGQAAPRAGGRHHRLGQVGLRERDAVLDPAAGHAERGAAGAGGSQAGRAQPLRAHPAPAHAGDHQPAPGRQRAGQPDQGDGGALRRR